MRDNIYIKYLTERFGKDITKRLAKLEQEYKELAEEAKNPTSDAFLDELADVNVILFHIAGLLGYTQYDLVFRAFDKIQGRESNPNNERKHPHKPFYCRMCSYNEGGWCRLLDCQVEEDDECKIK